MLFEMQSASPRIWTRVTVPISYEDNHYITGTSLHTDYLNVWTAWHWPKRFWPFRLSLVRFGLVLWHINHCSCLNFWDEAWWFLLLRVFGLLTSSLLLFSQRFGRHVLRPSSRVCRTQEPARNFKLRPLLNPRGSPFLIPFTIAGYKS